MSFIKKETEKKSLENIPVKTQVSDIPDKDIKATIIYMFKELKERQTKGN